MHAPGTDGTSTPRPYFTRVDRERPQTDWPALASLHLDAQPAAVPIVAEKKEAMLQFVQHSPFEPAVARLLLHVLHVLAHYMDTNLHELTDGTNALQPLYEYYLTADQLQLLLGKFSSTHFHRSTLSAAAMDACMPTQLCFGVTGTGSGKMCVLIEGHTVRCSYNRVDGRIQLPVYAVEVESEGMDGMEGYIQVY